MDRTAGPVVIAVPSEDELGDHPERGAAEDDDQGPDPFRQVAHRRGSLHRDLFRRTFEDRQEMVAALKAMQRDISELPRYVFRKNKALWEFQKACDAYDQATNRGVVRCADRRITARLPSVKYRSPVRFRRGAVLSQGPPPSM